MTGALLIVGDCPTGADRIAKDFWGGLRNVGMQIFYADWDKHGRAAGPFRNQRMIDERPDIVLGFSKDESRGTADCLRRAQKARIPIKLWMDPYVGPGEHDV